MFFSRFTITALYMEEKVGFTDSCSYCTCFCLRGVGAHLWSFKVEGPFNSQIHVCRDASLFQRPRRSIRLHGHFFPKRHEPRGLHPQRVIRRMSCRQRHGCVPRAGWAYETKRTTRRWEWCDHEVLLVMSPVIQATGWRIVDTWVQLHLMLTFAYSGVLQQVMDITEVSCASGSATTSSSGSTLMCIPKDPIKFIFELTGFTAAVPVVVRPGVYIHNALSVPSSLLVPARLRIMLTWCMALLVIVLHMACVSGTPHRISWTGDPVKKALAPLRSAVSSGSLCWL